MVSVAVWPPRQDAGCSPVVVEGVVNASLPNAVSRDVKTLKRRRDFLRVAGARQSIATRGLVLQTCPTERKDAELTVGFTASRKVGNAVMRNRARRRLRAAVEKVMPLHAAPEFDYVVIARAGTVVRPFDALTRDLETALKRLDVWRDQ